MTSPAPYPADTRAKGWRFELDYERIRQSDTWALTAPELRPWLLMLWMTAWEQTPCGSLPDDDELIAARIGMPIDLFKTSKARLLRGWWLADDGRLYHNTLTERVLDMLSVKDKERRRKAEYRARTAGGSPAPSNGTDDLSRGTDSGQTGESQGGDPGRDDTGTGTGTYTKGTKAAAVNTSTTVDPVDNLPSPPPPEPDGDSQKTEDDGLCTPARCAVLLNRWERARGKACEITSTDPRLEEWAGKPVTAKRLRAAYDLAVADREADEDPSPINAGFVGVFLTKVMRPPRQRDREPSAVMLPWPCAWSSIVAKGVEHGLEQEDGELAPAFKARVFAAAGLTDDERSQILADYGVRV